MGSRFVALLVAILFVVGLAAAGIYLYRQQHGGPPHAEDKTAAGESQQPLPSPAKPPEPAQSKPTAVPDFDVVRIESTGEGVIAGRGEPGWTVRVESGGATIAETTADEEGAWTIVLDEPLTPGDHSLSLRAVSPDGTRALTAQQSVQVAVGEAAAPGEQEVAAKPDEQAAAASNDLESQPQPVYPDENAPRERPKPPVKIGKLEYRDTGQDSGKISLSGDGQPNVQLYLFFDQQPLGEVTIGDDGLWAFEIEKKLEDGEHTIRADTYDEATGVVAGRASVRLGREPEAAEPEATPAEPAVAQAGQPSGQPEPVYPEEAAAEAPSPAPDASVAVAEPTPSRSQPQPVYPDGAPAMEASAPEPSTSVAAAEPFDLSSQPQPVVPEAAAEPEPEPAAPAVTAERPSEEARPEPKKPPVVFKSVDYRDTDSESGTVSLSGTGEPGANIVLFYDEVPLGQVIIGDDGTWAFEIEKKVETGEHNFRADLMEETTGIVVGRSSIGMVRLEKPQEPPKEEEVAAAPGPAESQPAEQAAGEPPRPEVHTVRRGDTLWDIAEEYFGGGWHYRAIVRENRGKIRDPHWIYPDQEFRLPAR